ncbi:MAG: carbamoyl phosphate synthase small subunit [Clostridia bacterium]|nr:carbamoyl phosphate synthase small subunit [Clostridia bacterium]
MAKLYLQLETGEVFVGESAGEAREVCGELVFTTGVVGYLESITDPCYRGQIVVGTYPLCGNYGITPDDANTDAPQLSALIVREICDAPANYRCAGSLEDYLIAHDMVCMTGVDTRALTALLREHGTVNARITCTPPAEPDDALRNYRVAAAGGGTAEVFPAAEPLHRVAVIDCGLTRPLVAALNARGCTVSVCPAETAAADILADRPDGVVITPGPGDPADYTSLTDTLRDLFGRLPMLGIGLGHQLLARAAGASTVKLHCGHRGSNQPVKDLVTGRVYITAQNHGYAVDAASLPQGAELRLVNVNDGSCEGIDYPASRAFGVQHNPLSADGALGMPVFDRFIQLFGEVNDRAL